MRGLYSAFFISAIMWSQSAMHADAQYSTPGGLAPYDAPPQVLIPQAGSVGRAMTPPTYYRSAPQFVPTTVYRPVTAYNPVTGRPYTRWQGATTMDTETRRVATPLPGYGAPFAAYRPMVPSPQMNVQGWVDPVSGNVNPGPVQAGYSSFRPALSVAPAYAVGRPAMSVPVVDYRGAWPVTGPVARPAYAGRPAQAVVPAYTPLPGAYTSYSPAYAAPVYQRPVYQAPVYSGVPASTGQVYQGQGYQGQSYQSQSYPAAGAIITQPSYTQPSNSQPTYSQPSYSQPSYSTPSTSSDPYYSSPSYGPRGSSSSSGAPADYQPTLRSSEIRSSEIRSPEIRSSTPVMREPAMREPAIREFDSTDTGIVSRAAANTAASDSTEPPATPPFANSAERNTTAKSASGLNAARPLVAPQETTSGAAQSPVNWPRFQPDKPIRKPAAASSPTQSESSSRPLSEESPVVKQPPVREPAVTREKPAQTRPLQEIDPEVRPLRDPDSRIPDLNNHRAPPLLEPRSAGISAPIRRLTYTPDENVTGHTANPAAPR